MKNLRLSMSLLALAAVASGCSSGDIEVKSDLGEISLVKESAVTSYSFDKDNAEKFLRKWIKTFREGFASCKQKDYLREAFCSDWGDLVREREQDLELLQKMPDIKIVKYRTIDTDVNGDKKASGYKYVSCIPKAESEIRSEWAKLISSIDGVNAKPKKDIENNLVDDGLVASSVQIKVCDKYGNI